MDKIFKLILTLAFSATAAYCILEHQGDVFPLKRFLYATFLIYCTCATTRAIYTRSLWIQKRIEEQRA